ncbi:unnamed protein product [Pieris macdunnoughi]|uniref:Peptidase A2 domain-containing protein n=1 Tax=Pieris macdunnoughi TaxID=345717 RepID=A0A821LSJ7_9NEOP|nr:unnamed protein product [Pieris macdunnoughi]
MYQTLQLATRQLAVGKQETQSVDAATDCSHQSRRIFVTDKHSKLQYLVDTGSDLCCFPKRLAKNRRASADFDLSAANGSSIKTYGNISLHLNLGLRRDFPRKTQLISLYDFDGKWLKYNRHRHRDMAPNDPSYLKSYLERRTYFCVTIPSDVL